MKNKHHLEIVDALCSIESGLSYWEVNFADSLSKSLEYHNSLTEKQAQKSISILSRFGIQAETPGFWNE